MGGVIRLLLEKMIILTDPKQVNTVLGNNTALTGYDRMVLSPITFDVSKGLISARVVLTSATQPDMLPIEGSLEVYAGTGKLKIAIPEASFRKGMTLSPGQITAVNKQINDAQNSVETGIVSMNLVAGTQSPGS